MWSVLRSARRGFEDQEVLLRKERVLRRELVACALELGFDAARGGSLVLQDAAGRVHVIDDRKASARLEVSAYGAKIADAIANMMIHVDHEHNVDRAGKLRVLGRPLDGCQVGEPLSLAALGQERCPRWSGPPAPPRPRRQQCRDPYREITGA